MEYDSTWQIVAFIACVIFSAFFSSSETALMSLSKIRIRHMIEEDVSGAKTIDKLVQNPSKLLSVILVGNTIANIFSSALATSLAIHYWGDKGVGIATGIVTLVVLIFAEITPKSLANTYAERYSLLVSKPIYFLSIVLTPFTAVFAIIANMFLWLLGGKKAKKAFITEEEIKTMVDVSHEEGVLEIEEREMIHKVFEFNDTIVKDVIIPRTDIVAIDKSLKYNEIMEIFKREQYSRIPVYEEQIDNIAGILHLKDLCFLDIDNNTFNIDNVLRTPFFTYEYKKIDELFSEMKKKRVNIAVVMDEYGGVAGIVTMEDLIEETVGEIEDEYDEVENEIQVVKEDEYIVDGSTKLDTMNEMIGTHIESEEFDSLGGFIIGQLGGFPETGATLEYCNMKFIVNEIENFRIKKVKVLM